MNIELDWESLLEFNFDDENLLKESNNIIAFVPHINENNQFDAYSNDYKKLISVESILKDKSYYEVKYSIITRHLINMDDYYLILKQNQINYEENFTNSQLSSSNISLNKSKSKSKSKISCISGERTIKDLNEFKLGYTKKLLQIFENEKMTGKEFEEYARRTLYLMFLMIKKDNYKILNPKNANLKILDNFLQKYFMNNKIILFKEDTCEIDIIINDFEKKDLEQLINNYQNNFYFTEELHLNKLNEKFNIIGEIARNLIYQSNSKKKQINNYIELIDKLNNIKNENIKKNTNESKNNNNNIIKPNEFEESQNNISLSENSEKVIDKTNIDLQKILKSFELKDISKDNIFIILTNGPYLLFKIVFDITNELLKRNNFDDNYLKQQIEKYETIFKNLTDSKKNIFEKIKNLYIIFLNLRKKNIHHCVMYLGTNSENLKDDNIFKNVELIENNMKYKENSKEFYDFVVIKKLKNGIVNMLNIKDEFDEKYDLFIKNVNKKFSDNKIKQNILEKIKIKNSFKLKLNIYFHEEKKVVNQSDNFIIKTNILENIDNKQYLFDLIENLMRKKENKEIYLILLPQNKAFPYLSFNNDNLFINYLENKELNKDISFRFKYNDFCERFLKDEFENFSKTKFDYKKEISFDFDNFDFSFVAKTINNKIKPEFTIDENNLRSVYDIIDVGSEINDNLIMKIVDNIEKTTNKKDNSNLRKAIRKNVTKLEENIKLKLFYDYFIKIILKDACIKSTIEKFKDLNDDILNIL